MQQYLYLTLNLAAFIVPFAFSFYPKANFSKKWKYVIPAILITGIIFLVWDEIFTRMGVWGFSERYVTGINILSLPVEEVLFFFCIPYACVFTYFAMNHLVDRDHLFPHQEIITSVIIVGCLVFGMYAMNHAYTGVTFLALGLFLAWHLLKLRPRYMGRFYFAYGVLLIPFLIVNGILTGSFIEGEVVWYNDNENLGLRIGTIPVEDIFYGMLMILMSITIAEELERREIY